MRPRRKGGGIRRRSTIAREGGGRGEGRGRLKIRGDGGGAGGGARGRERGRRAASVGEADRRGPGTDPPWREVVCSRAPDAGKGEIAADVAYSRSVASTAAFLVGCTRRTTRGCRTRRFFDDYRSAEFPLGGLPRIDTTIRTGSLLVLVGHIVAICLLAGCFPSTLLTAITGLLLLPWQHETLAEEHYFLCPSSLN